MENEGQADSSGFNPVFLASSNQPMLKIGTPSFLAWAKFPSCPLLKINCVTPFFTLSHASAPSCTANFFRTQLVFSARSSLR